MHDVPPVLTLRAASMDDAATLLAWRNDPVTRAQSRQQGEIAWADHCRWLARVLNDPGCLVLVGWCGGERCGTVRFSTDGDGRPWEVSIVLAPAWRGQGLGRRLLAGGVARLRAAHPGAGVLAAVRPGNRASAALFLGAGFHPVPSDEEFAHFMLTADDSAGASSL